MRSTLETFMAMRMIGVHLPTADGRELILTRHTEPEPPPRLLLDRLGLRFPAQPAPRIVAASAPGQGTMS